MMLLLRSGVYNVYFVAMTIVYGLAGVPCRLFFPGWALPVAQGWARTLVAGARSICGIEVAVIGRENLPDGPALIASQHQSAFDTLIWLTLVPRVSYVYKAELARIPLFGSLLKPSGQIMLDRGASFAAVKSLLKGAERAVADGRQIVIFPEGTRVVPGAEVAPLPGVTALATRTGLSIVPVATDSGRLWGRRAFRKWPGTIHIVIGPPIPPGQAQPAVLAALREAWRTAAAQGAACG